MKKHTLKIPWTSNITEVQQDSLKTHGLDQCEIIRDFSYAEMVYFLLKGKRPDDVTEDLLRAILVAYISHGITGQSTLAVMEAADCRSEFFHALMAGFLVGSGPYHLGGLYAAMVEIEKLAKLSRTALQDYVETCLQQRTRIIGFGHRFHRNDPRVKTLFQIAKNENFCGPHIKTAQQIREILHARKGISMNIEGAVASLLLDLGFPPAIGCLFVILGRSPMFAAAYLERLSQGRAPFQKIEVADVFEVDAEAQLNN